MSRFFFGVSGLVPFCILENHYYLAGFFIIFLKSGIDAADGELARIKKPFLYRQIP
jgi:phosphatidylglycerophosphate synthase